MNIDNPNKVFKPISFTIEEEWEVSKFKTILNHAVRDIENAEYVFGEEELMEMINKMLEAIK